MASNRPTRNPDRKTERAPDPLGSELRQLKGGRAFPPGFDPQAIARRARRRRHAWRGGTLGALGLAVLWVLYDPGLTADYSAPVGSVERVTLPDGTVAQLDSGASMSWSVSESERRIHLHAGIAVFETAAGSARDLVVVTEAVEVRPVGTVFAVSTDGTAWSALVQSGRVHVALPKAGASTRIGPGEAVSLDDSDTRLATSAIDVERALAWREGVLDFKNAPLAEVIATLDRYRPGRILLLSQEAASKRFDGVLSLDDIDRSLQIVAESSGLEPLATWPMLVILR